MASASMAQSLLRHRKLRRLLASHPPLAASVVSSSSPLRSFHTEEGESAEDFENSLFGDGSPNRSSFYKKLDRVGSPRARFGMGFDSLNDGMNEKLDQAARTFVYSDEVFDEDYAFRPDVTYRRGSMYSVKDLDLTKPAAPKYAPRMQFETTTEEVLRKADFRNVRFLSNFLTEAGIIIKRSQTRISAKAQRKIAREIKTARAFGLMPFTTMGTKPFIFGRSMEEALQDYEYFEGVEQNAVGPGEDTEPGEGDA